MARRVRWTPAALADLDDIAGYIAQDSRYYAAMFVRRIKLATGSLGTFSMRTRMVPELGDENVRELLLGEYRIIFRIMEQEVQIISVLNQARDLGRMLD